MGVSRNTVYNNERGKVVPRRIVLKAWAMATGVDLTWIETGSTTENPRPDGPDGGGEVEVRHQGLEPRTRWFRPQTAVTTPRTGIRYPLPAAS